MPPRLTSRDQSRWKYCFTDLAGNKKRWEQPRSRHRSQVKLTTLILGMSCGVFCVSRATLSLTFLQHTMLMRRWTINNLKSSWLTYLDRAPEEWPDSSHPPLPSSDRLGASEKLRAKPGSRLECDRSPASDWSQYWPLIGQWHFVPSVIDANHFGGSSGDTGGGISI